MKRSAPWVPPGPEKGDTPARVLFAVFQQAALCDTSSELAWLVTGDRAAKTCRLYAQYLLPFGDPHRRMLSIESAWRWCRAAARASSVLRLSILLEPGHARLGVFRVDTGKRFLIRLCDPAWVVGEGLVTPKGETSDEEERPVSEGRES